MPRPKQFVPGGVLKSFIPMLFRRCGDTADKMMTIRRYSEIMALRTITERYEYLKLNGQVAEETFGIDRWINQEFYSSQEWRRLRDHIIFRDNGCDLGVDGYEIHGRIYVHHMNPITTEDILSHSAFLVDPDYLICCSYDTHQAIHFGDKNLLPVDPIARKPNDTCPWR